MIRVQLSFTCEEEYDRAFEAVDWIVERLGHSTSIEHLPPEYQVFAGWRYLIPEVHKTILDFLDQEGVWWHCSDIGQYSEKSYQQFFFKDSSIALQFKLAFG